MDLFRMMRGAAVGGALLVLSGCVVTAPPPGPPPLPGPGPVDPPYPWPGPIGPGPVDGPGVCVDRSVGFAYGRRPTDRVIERIMERTGASRLRVLEYREPATREYLRFRVTVRLDPFGRISSVRCG